MATKTKPYTFEQLIADHTRLIKHLAWVDSDLTAETFTGKVGEAAIALRLSASEEFRAAARDLDAAHEALTEALALPADGVQSRLLRKADRRLSKIDPAL